MEKKNLKKISTFGLVRDLNPGPLAPEARIIPLDQRANLKTFFMLIITKLLIK